MPRSCGTGDSRGWRHAAAGTRPTIARPTGRWSEHDGRDGMTPPNRFQATLLVARKDLAIEFRTRSAYFSALVFSLIGIAIFYFAWDATAVSSSDLAPGVLWVIFTFSGLL